MSTGLNKNGFRVGGRQGWSLVHPAAPDRPYITIHSLEHVGTHGQGLSEKISGIEKPKYDLKSQSKHKREEEDGDI
jgi:hypothetical protein